MSKKDAALHGVSKKDRRKLEDRTVEIAAELERRAAKKAKKAKKTERVQVPAGASAATAHQLAVRDAEIAAHDSALKERIAEKRAAREALSPAASPALPSADSVDRSSEAAVKEYNSLVMASGGGTLLTSDAERARTAERFHDNVSKVEAAAIEKTVDAVEAIRSAIKEVETGRGRVFEAGNAATESTTVTAVTAVTAVPDVANEFAKPSNAEPELEAGRNGYKIMKLDADGVPDPRTVRQYTRVTTFVGNIDDDTMIRDWEKRLLAVGLSANASDFAPRVNDLTHVRDVAIAKARKADRKGKLGLGELGSVVYLATKQWRDAVNLIVAEALDLAGCDDKADAGTSLHSIAEIADAEGMAVVDEMLASEKISISEHASIAAYSARMARLGARVIETEAVVVNDAMGYAGRLDRIVMAKLPEITLRTAAGDVVRPADTRARRYVTDIKSGRIDLGAGKIARQLAAYALGDLYDLKTGERSRHSASRDVALVFHLPQGEGTCTVHAVDIKHGAELLKLSAQVREARRTGRKTIDASVDIADPEPGGTVINETNGGE